MSKRFISMELVFGAAVLLIIGVASSMATNQTVAKISRDECIEQVVDFLEQVEIDDQVEARLDYARNLYFEKRLPWNKYLVYPAPAGCMRLKGLMSSVGSAVPCFSDISVMGESDLQNELELIRASKGAKRALEAEVACSVAYHAGEVLRGKKWFKTIVTPYEIKGEINRDECIKAAVAFFEEIPIDDHVKARVEYVRQYYYTEMDFNGYIPHCPEICDVFLRKLYNFREVVPCWQSELIMGKDMKDENLLAAINAGERTKLVIEAWFACQQDQYTGQLMRKRGVFNAIVGRS